MHDLMLNIFGILVLFIIGMIIVDVVGMLASTDALDVIDHGCKGHVDVREANC